MSLTATILNQSFSSEDEDSDYTDSNNSQGLTEDDNIDDNIDDSSNQNQNKKQCCVIL